MATLARLMPGPPEFIEPEYLAKTEANISGELALSGMRRLQELLHGDSGRVVFSLDFARKNGLACITGEFKASVELLCQRCLQAFASELANTVKTGIAVDETQIKQLGEDFEPLIVPEKKLLLAKFLEDEMLLAMPLAATHPPDSCPGEKLLDSMQVKKENPFAVLKDLRKL